MLNLQLMLFALILTGIIVKKLDIINANSRKSLSDLLINVILPCNIIQSFLGGAAVTGEFYKNCVIAVLLSTGVQLFSVFISRFLFRSYPKEKKHVMTYGMICSNSSFIGIPIAETLYGNLGVLYTSIFQIPIRFTMWTSGLSLFTNINKKDAFHKLAKHPCIISIFIGFFLMLTDVSLPGFLGDTIAVVSKCNVPISMIVIGSILAEKYDCDSMFASQLIFVSTFCSIFTIPALSLLIR